MNRNGNIISTDESLLSVKGIGEKTFDLLKKLDLYTVGDLLECYPRTYKSFPEAKRSLSELADAEGKGGQLRMGGSDSLSYDVPVGQDVALYATVAKAVSVKKTRRFDVSTTTLRIGSDTIGAVWFRAAYVRSQLKVGETYVFYGRLDRSGSLLELEQPKIYDETTYMQLRHSLHPVYPLTKGLKNTNLEKAVAAILKNGRIQEYLPEELLKKRGLIEMDEAVRRIHFPKSEEELREAGKRLSYNEFFDFLLRVELEKGNTEKVLNEFNFDSSEDYEKAYKSLPFELTDGQKEALKEMREDLKGEYISQRLIQGDVGSGKTIIAFLIMLLAVENGYKAAIMAPTEVLAGQHYETFKKYILDFSLSYPVYLLTGSMKQKEKREVYSRLSSDEPCFVVGTHALIQDKADYNNLAVVVTDEQHRFGVKQRLILSKKGSAPFVLVMSATPIPRTLAMILYQDMKISAIRDVPARRLPIKNAIMHPDERTKVYQFMAKEIREGHQVYIICPLVEASEKTEAENVTEYAESLREAMGSAYRVGVLHGKMKAEDKNRIMNDFYAKSLDILVSTTVVEVGVNVPNATVMLIENADRFGLAQLHQLRGRVGRGDAQSYCIFMDASGSDKNSKRLEILKDSNDGFEIASEDLKLRGPGDFYGVRQSGDMCFKVADLYRDADLLSMAKDDVSDILSRDSSLSSVAHQGILHRIRAAEEHIYENL
ncbi:MAG: ATP-dependent DNA helicase RecG [Lachnospiraceae bacterium]|nr:ATP-dependent DNA helicase RecG [Lachnospiraceae bacterium]